MTDKTQNPELDGLAETAGDGAPLLADTDPVDRPTLTDEQLADIAREADEWSNVSSGDVKLLIAALTAEREAHAGDEALRRKQVVGLQDQLAIERDRAEQAERQVRAYTVEAMAQAIHEAECEAYTHEGRNGRCERAAKAIRRALSGVSGPTTGACSICGAPSDGVHDGSIHDARVTDGPFPRPTTEGASE